MLVLQISFQHNYKTQFSILWTVYLFIIILLQLVIFIPRNSGTYPLGKICKKLNWKLLQKVIKLMYSSKYCHVVSLAFSVFLLLITLCIVINSHLFIDYFNLSHIVFRYIAKQLYKRKCFQTALCTYLSYFICLSAQMSQVYNFYPYFSKLYII